MYVPHQILAKWSLGPPASMKLSVQEAIDPLLDSSKYDHIETFVTSGGCLHNPRKSMATHKPSFLQPELKDFKEAVLRP